MTPELQREFESALDLVATGINVRNSIRRAFRPLFERLAADAERIDWIEELGFGGELRQVGNTLREAIDEARK